MSEAARQEHDRRRALIEELVTRTVSEAATTVNDVDAVTGILIDLNRLAGDVTRPEIGPGAGRQIESLLRRLSAFAAQHPEAREYAAGMINRVNELAALGVTSDGGRGSGQTRRRDQANVEYFVRDGARGVRLVESRGTLKDFFVTREDFEHGVDAIAKTAKPDADFDEIHEQFVSGGGVELRSAYPLRVVLRFLRAHGLIRGARGKYSIGDQKSRSFRAKAKAAWDELPRR